MSYSDFFFYSGINMLGQTPNYCIYCNEQKDFLVSEIKRELVETLQENHSFIWWLIDILVSKHVIFWIQKISGAEVKITITGLTVMAVHLHLSPLLGDALTVKWTPHVHKRAWCPKEDKPKDKIWLLIYMFSPC